MFNRVVFKKFVAEFAKRESMHTQFHVLGKP